MNGRVFNYSSRSVLVLAPKKRNRGLAWYRLGPGCETPLEFNASAIRATEKDATIMGKVAWGVDRCVLHVVDRPGKGPPGFSAPATDVPIRIVGMECVELSAERLDELPTDLDKPEPLTLLPVRPWVTILGAGIAGLTAAHELVERGFQVQVVEKSHGSPVATTGDEDHTVKRFHRGLEDPDIGGIARTQWSTAPMQRTTGQASILNALERKRANAERGETKDPDPQLLLRTKSIHGDGDWYGLEARGWLEQPAFVVPFDTKSNALNERGLKALIEKWLTDAKRDSAVAAVQIVVIVYRPIEGEAVPVYGTAPAYARLKTFLDWLNEDKEKNNPFSEFVETFPVARIEVDEKAAPTEHSFPGLLIRQHDHLGLIAGEHGFRFFPGFYRHLRDTMKRTPIYDPVDQRFTERTAHDNLTEVDYQSIEDPKRRHGSSFLRKKFSSLGAMVNQYTQLRTDLGYRPSDLLRFMLRMARYMTSSTRRRKEHYERLTWWDFLSIRHLGASHRSPPKDSKHDTLTYGARFERAIRHSPEALVAMKSEVADARTQGNISVQLAMDQFNLHEHTDSTLAGPTSESWFRHWREYLEQQGVQFFCGEVTSIDYSDKGGLAVHIEFPEYPGKEPPEFFDARTGIEEEPRQPHYYVCAMDAISVERVTRNLRSHHRVGTLASIEALTTRTAASPRKNPESLEVSQDQQYPYQTLSGIQLYYLPRVSFEAAHIYYADSAWGLSAVSQIQYWGPLGTGGVHSKLLGNLSIDIGCWRGREQTNVLRSAPNPSDCPPFDIAKEIYTEITDGRTPDALTPSFFHIDDYIQFASSGGRAPILPKWNRSPFLINVVDGWNDRPPGEPWSPSDRRARGSRIPGYGRDVDFTWRHHDGGYEIYFSNLVFAGTHMRTFTRMGTMESANESARHAVNAILDHLTFTIAPPGRHVEHEKETGTREANVPEQLATPFGDYCDIWNPEENEFEDLDFLRWIDNYLFEHHKANPRSSDDVVKDRSPAIPPHLFDLLGVDRLPDLIDNDEDAIKVFDMLRDGVKYLEGKRNEDLSQLLANVDSLKKQFATFYKRK